MRKILPTKFGATPAERRPWCAPSVAWVLMATLGLQVGLYLSQLVGGWGKGVAVLIAVAGTAGLLLCVVACRVFIKSQFGLRTLLLTVVVVAVPCGWMGRELELARHQRELVERVSRYNYLDGGQRLVLKWLRKSLGEDFFAELEGVVLEDSETHASLTHLPGLTNLRSLYLMGTPVTDDGLAHLRGLTNLQTLGLLGTLVTDDGLVHLQGLKNLQFLYLAGTQVTDERVRQLQADLPECQMDR